MSKVLRITRTAAAVVAIVCPSLIADPASGQADRPLYVTGGLGIPVVGPDGGVAYGALVAHPWALRGVFAETVFGGEEDRPDQIWDIGVLRLLRHDAAEGFLQAGIGLAVTGGERDFRLDGSDRTFTTLGIPLQAVAVLAPAEWLGVGLGVVGNVNLEESLVGFMATVSLGRVRP